jgi:hypothetical protein
LNLLIKTNQSGLNINILVHMKKFLTSVVAIHNVTSQLGKWPGPIIEANSFEEADDWCKFNTEYLFVEREIIDVNLNDQSSQSLN